MPGDGIGGTEILIGDQRGSVCIDACKQRKQINSSINGVTLFSEAIKGGCWCEKGMKGRNNNTKYMSCYTGVVGK